MTRPLTLLDKVGLLAGEPVAGPTCATGSGRTCIDGGRGALVTLCSSGALGYAVAAEAKDGLQHWRRGCFGSDRAGAGAMVTETGAAPCEAAMALVPVADGLARDRLRMIAGYGKVYMATAAEPESGQSWLSFMLHPRQTLRPVLAQLGISAAWPELRRAFSDVLTRPVTDALRPWSVAVEATTGALRIGTTAWARLPETAEKARAMHAALGTYGPGPAEGAAIYSLAARPSADTNRPTRAGVAAEFDLTGTSISGAMFTLRLNS